MKLLYISTIFTAVIFLQFTVSAADDLPAPAQQVIDFDEHIAPVLVQHCQSCHGPDKQEAACAWMVAMRPSLAAIPVKPYRLARASTVA